MPEAARPRFFSRGRIIIFINSLLSEILSGAEIDRSIFRLTIFLS